MSYKYSEQRDKIFTESGVKLLRAVEAEVNRLLETAGAFQMLKIRPNIGHDSFTLLACLDYLEEQGKIVKLPRPGCWGQYEVYASPQTTNY